MISVWFPIIDIIHFLFFLDPNQFRSRKKVQRLRIQITSNKFTLCLCTTHIPTYLEQKRINFFCVSPSQIILWIIKALMYYKPKSWIAYRIHIHTWNHWLWCRQVNEKSKFSNCELLVSYHSSLLHIYIFFLHFPSFIWENDDITFFLDFLVTVKLNFFTMPNEQIWKKDFFFFFHKLTYV